MPAPGDQHNNRFGNPFEDAKPRISEYTAQEIATLQSRLERQLGPEYLSSRSGPSGQKVHYIAAEKVIGLANEVFGFNGWSSSIQNIQVDFVDEHPQTLKISLGLHVVVRVTLRDGSFHEDIGYGHIENCKGKAAAFEKAKKEGTTDALKRTLRNFGNVLGNCIYDKSYLAKVIKIKVEPSSGFDESALHRHPDFAKKNGTNGAAVKTEPAANANSSTTIPSLPDSFDDFLGEFDEADFAVADVDENPDEVVLDTSHLNNNDKPTNGSHPGGGSNVAQCQRPPQPQQPPQTNANARPMQPPSRPPTVASGNVPPQTPNMQHGRPGPPQQPPQYGNRPQNNHQHQLSNGSSNNGRPHQPTVPSMAQRAGNNGPSAHQTPPPPQPQPAPQNGMGGGMAGGNESGPVAFFSARAVPRVAEDSPLDGPPPALPKAAQLFNPKAESPSIRKTPGIDHNSSRPVARNGQHVAPVTSSQAGAAASAIAANDRPSGAGLGGGPAGPVMGMGMGHSALVNNNYPHPQPPRPQPHPQQHQQHQQQQQQHSPLAGGGGGGARGNVVNPQLDHARRIGAPGGPGSPLSNRGQYKPPTMTAKRPPLADLPNGAAANPAGAGGGGGGGGGDAKRVKLG